jgi:hypothetical protein
MAAILMEAGAIDIRAYRQVCLGVGPGGSLGKSYVLERE